jgi:hypothetical protein
MAKLGYGGSRNPTCHTCTFGESWLVRCPGPPPPSGGQRCPTVGFISAKDPHPPLLLTALSSA